jgi:hypothetical protein
MGARQLQAMKPMDTVIIVTPVDSPRINTSHILLVAVEAPAVKRRAAELLWAANFAGTSGG